MAYFPYGGFAPGGFEALVGGVLGEVDQQRKRRLEDEEIARRQREEDEQRRRQERSDQLSRAENWRRATEQQIEMRERGYTPKVTGQTMVGGMMIPNAGYEKTGPTPQETADTRSAEVGLLLQKIYSARDQDEQRSIIAGLSPKEAALLPYIGSVAAKDVVTDPKPTPTDRATDSRIYTETGKVLAEKGVDPASATPGQIRWAREEATRQVAVRSGQQAPAGPGRNFAFADVTPEGQELYAQAGTIYHKLLQEASDDEEEMLAHKWFQAIRRAILANDLNTARGEMARVAEPLQTVESDSTRTSF